MVSRPQLLARIQEAADASLVLLTAPPGYGKTTLLSEWAAADERSFAWVDLGRAESDGAALLTAIVEALAEIEPAAAEPLALLKEPMPHLSAVVPRLAAGLAAASASPVLVLDDVDLLDSAESMEVIESVRDCLPEGAQMALAGRSSPRLPLGRLRAHRRLFQLGIDDLAMTPDDAAELFAHLGLTVHKAELEALISKTEGWPVALYLAGLSLVDRADAEEAVASFAGDDRVVAEYLRDEFISHFPEEQLEFLMKIAVLDRFCGELCDAMLERSGSDRILAELSDSNRLIMPLDRKGEWFRLHGLLATALTRELGRRDPGAEAALHLRASTWFAEHDDHDRAIEHAIAGGDVVSAGGLIWGLIPEYTARGRNSTMLGWLGRFTEEQTCAVPLLALAAFHSALIAGRGADAERFLRAAAHADGGSLSRPEKGPNAAAVMTARAEIGREGLTRMLDDARLAKGLEPEHSPWQALCLMLEGIALSLSGDFEPAKAALEEGSRKAAVSAPMVQVICLAQLAVLALGEDDRITAEILASQARAQVGRSNLGEYPAAALPIAASALVLAPRDTSRARTDAARAARLLARCVEMPPWFETESCLLLARAFLRLADSAEANPQLGRARKLIRGPGDSPLVRQWLGAAEAEAARLAEVGADEPGLTGAELRVLGYLPTHLSLREIAEEFVVSQNTVKTQAQAIYRKLGVSSRAEAVAAGRAAGLLDESAQRS